VRTVRFGLVLVVAVVFSLGGTGSALAHHKPDHPGGPPATASAIGSDHDGDADADPETTMEDSHAADPAPDTDNRHPSGRDRSGESGRSGNQGHSESDPDGDANGGIDKPGGAATAGGDLADQDGNNGCGNDDDFEDDNNGHCGKGKADPPPSPTTPPPTSPTTPAIPSDPGTSSPTTGGTVLGEHAGGGGPGAGGAEVLGETLIAAGELAFTGLEMWPLALIAVGLALPGLILVSIGRRRARTD
jgi:hypothetical protein